MELAGLRTNEMKRKIKGDIWPQFPAHQPRTCWNAWDNKDSSAQNNHKLTEAVDLWGRLITLMDFLFTSKSCYASKVRQELGLFVIEQMTFTIATAWTSSLVMQLFYLSKEYPGLWIDPVWHFTLIWSWKSKTGHGYWPWKWFTVRVRNSMGDRGLLAGVTSN